MIFPWLSGILSPFKAPVTYFLVVLNVAIFASTYRSSEASDVKIDAFFDDDAFLMTQGSAFAVMINREPASFSPPLRTLSKNALQGESDAREVLGGFAMRDSNFMSRAQTFDFGGDAVAVERWRKKLTEFQTVQDTNPSYRLGLSELHHEWMNWFTYQFTHAGFAHLFWNMIFLLIFGCFVETELGGSFVSIAYIIGGLIGALAYSYLSGISYSPLVGASGAVSGLIGLVTVAWARRERVRFFYVLVPLSEYMGVARLPSWLLALTFILPDVSHYLSSSREVGSVAYAAHIGGALFGAFIALGVIAGYLPAKSKVH